MNYPFRPNFKALSTFILFFSVYPVGTFVQIMEMQDLGQKIRMVVMAHRRIKILNTVTEEDVETTVAAETAASIEHVPEGPLTPISSGDEPKHDKNSSVETSDTSNANLKGVFTVETENVVHQEYETTDEIKALTQEVIKTIRDIIVSIHFL